MSLFRGIIIIATISGLMLGIVAVNGQMNTELPQFKSGASVTMGVPVDFNILSQRVGAIYDVVESDNSHIVWKFTGTTGDWVFVFADGRIIVASTVDFNLDAKDTVFKELNDAMDMLNAVFAGIVSDEARNNALDSAIYYASEPEIYHRIKYSFKNKLDLTLVVPSCTIEKARMTVTGGECCYEGQAYYLDGQEIFSCGRNDGEWCGVSPAEITDKIPVGLHAISSSPQINDAHILILETITSPLPPKQFVIYGPNYIPWINETGKSMTIDNMNSLIAGNVINTTT